MPRTLEARPPDRTVELADGRTLGYVEVGDPSGYPVVSNHGGLSSRLDILPSHESALAHGLRIVSPDRPGIGLSDSQPDRTMAGWATDVGELADQLGLDRFATMGWSFGGCFAQSVARHLSARVSVLALIASGVPIDWEGMATQINEMDQHFMKMAESRTGRVAEASIFHLLSWSARIAPKEYAKGSHFVGSSPEEFSAAIAEGLSDSKGVIADYQILNRPWGFDPSEIVVPTQIWQGDADELVPPSWGPRLHEAIAGSKLNIVPGATHYLWYEHWDEIFAGIAELAGES